MLKDCSEDIKEKAEAILVKGLGDTALRLCMGESPDVFNMIESIDKIFGSKRAASKIAVLTSVFSKRYAYNKNTTRYIDEHNQALAQLESMDEDADILDSLKGPILISSFGTDSQLESCIAVLRVRDSIPSWKELTADFILEAIRIRTLQKNSDPDNDANPKAGKKRLSSQTRSSPKLEIRHASTVTCKDIPRTSIIRALRISTTDFRNGKRMLS